MMKLQSQHRKQTGHGYAIKGADGSWFNEERTGTEAGMAKFLLETKYSKHTNKTAPTTTTKGGKGDKWDKKQHENAAEKAIADYDKYISDLLEDWADDSEKAAEQLKFLDPKTLSENHEKTIAEIKREGKEALSAIKEEQDEIIKKAREKEIDVWVHGAKGRKKENAPAQKKTDEKYREELFGEGTELGKAYAQREADANKLNEAKLLKANRDFQEQLIKDNQTSYDARLEAEKEYSDKINAIDLAIKMAQENAEFDPEQQQKLEALFRVKEKLQQDHYGKQRESMWSYMKEYGSLEEQLSATNEQYAKELADLVGGETILHDLQQEAGFDNEKLVQLAIERKVPEGEIRTILRQQAEETTEIQKQMNGVGTEATRLAEAMNKTNWKAIQRALNEAKTMRDNIVKSGSYAEFKELSPDSLLTETEYNQYKNNEGGAMAQLNKNIDEADDKVAKLKSPFSALKASVQELFHPSKDENGDNKQTLEERLAAVANPISAVNEQLGSLGRMFSALGESLGNEFLSNLGEGITIASDAISSLTSGDIFGAFTSIFTGISEMIDRKHQKRIEQLADQIEVLQEQYDDLGDAVAEAFSKDASQLIAQQNQLLEQQKVLIQQQRREEEAKKKTDKDKLKDYDKQLRDIDKALEENKEKAIDAIFGEDVQSAIESFAESLTSAWENGTNSVKGARDQVKRMMRQMVQESIKAAIQSSNKIEEIRAKLQEYYADNFLSEYEQRAVMKMAEDYQRELNEQFGWSEKLFSEDYEAGNGTSGGFATMSQESADELNGRFTAMQVKMENQLAQQIIANTHLATMELSLTSQSRILSEMRDLHVKSNEYLLSIVENTQDIVPKLNNLIQRIDVKL